MKTFKKINPNEYGGLLYNEEKIEEIKKILQTKKIFRYSSRKISITDKLENCVKKYLDINFALGLNSGTSALKTALFAVGVKPGDRVLISSFTFIATAAVVISLGAIPIPIDFDFNNCMNIDDLKTEIAKGCKVIVPVHIQGRTFDLTQIIKLAKKNKIMVVEDACQAFASKYLDKFSGTIGDVGVYSFQQYKQISAGEGGMLVTNNEKIYKQAKIYSDHGMVRETMTWDDEMATIGENSRMNNLQAAIVKIQIKNIKSILRLQHKNRMYIMKHIGKIDNLINSPDIKGETGMNILFLLKNKETADLAIANARGKNIEIRRLWDRPYYIHGVFKKIKLRPEDLGKNKCVVAEDISERLVSVSIPPTLEQKHLNRIIKEIRQLKK
ncbi:MAG: aminotransferase class I/II-fold pyridoxal phosphate-dependent enzyme [Candidatus Shapirobacteria bacterium]|nr:aminotransferase class I/II-fold pyridoxal phosphate-dependent enzyme [Candidatus Shapirobacteria bacterium]